MRFTYTQKNPRRISHLRSCIATAGPGSGIVPATPTRLMVMSGCTMNWPNSSVMPGHRPPPTRSGRGAINLRSTAGTLLLPGQPPSTQWVFRDEQRGAGGGAPVRPHPRGRRRGSTRRGRRRKGIGAAGGWSSLRGRVLQTTEPDVDTGSREGLMPSSCMAVEGGPPRSVRRCEACRARPGSARRGRCGGGERQGAVARGLHGRRRGQRPTWSNWSARRLTQNGSSGAGRAGPVIAVGGSKHTRQGAPTTHLAVRDPRALPAEGALTPATGRVCIDPCRARR